MLDNPKTTEQALSKSGVLPRPILVDQKLLRETPPPIASDLRDDGATTGIIQIIVEGEDKSAQRDDDKGE